MYLGAQLRHLVRQLGRASGRLAEPERHRGRRALGVLDPDAAALDPAYAPRRVAEQEDIAARALDREVLVHGADEGVVRLRDDVVVGVVGDGAAARHRGEPRAPAPAQPAVHAVAVHVGGAPSLARGDAAGERLQHLLVPVERQVAVRVRPAHQLVQDVLAPLAGAALGDDLLRQHVERPVGNEEPVEVAALEPADHRHALDQLVARQREEPALRRAADLVARASHALQHQADGARRPYLADEVDGADVDAELERRRRDAERDLAGLEPLLGVVAALLRQAAVVRHHRVLAQSGRTSAASRARRAGGC